MMSTKTNITSIIVREKPANVSWDEIHNVLYSAHKPNRELGIFQLTAELPGEKLAQAVGDGTCFVAMDGDKVIGTCSVKIKTPKRWFARERAAYYMLAGVLPEYQGRGVYSMLDHARDQFAKENHIDVIYTYTPQKNVKLQQLRLSKGFHLAGFFAPSNVNYYSVILVKWNNPPCLLYVRLRYLLAKWTTMLKYKR